MKTLLKILCNPICTVPFYSVHLHPDKKGDAYD